jgi:hypothetical protein
MLMGRLSWSATLSLPRWSNEHHFRVAGALWGGISGNIAVFDTLIAPEQLQFEYAEETDVGGEFQIKVCTISAFDKGTAAVRCC